VTTLQDYTCPVHGVFEVTCDGHVPDTRPCGRTEWVNATQGTVCMAEATWTPSIGGIRTAETHRLALLDWARSENPW
jgi:hypothetical protein